MVQETADEAVMAGEREFDLGIPGIEHAVFVGRGRSATVYRAFHPALKRLVAVKILGGLDGSDDLFPREREPLLRLAGEANIVAVYEAGTNRQGRHYLIMAFMEKGSLAEQLGRDGPMPWQAVVDIGVAMAGALQVAHNVGVYHSDVRPENILFSGDDVPHLVDFGIARFGHVTPTAKTSEWFSMAHFAPETWDGRPPSAAGDIYSLASTLFEAIAGRPAFLDDDEHAEPGRRSIARAVPDLLRPRQVPEAVCRAIEKAMAEDPADRPASAAVFADNLKAAIAGGPGHPAAPPPATAGTKGEQEVDLGIVGVERAVFKGHGGSGTVYRAFQPTFKRFVAVKVLSALDISDNLFRRECETLGRLAGEANIVTVYEAGTNKQRQHYLIMAFMEKGSLAERLRRDGPMPWEAAVEIGVAIAGALQVAHDARILHRDVKPENILFSRNDVPHLADFGIARFSDVTLTTKTTEWFSLAHVAPETLKDQSPSEAVDIYSLASTLFETIAGRPAFIENDDDGEPVIRIRILEAALPDLLRPRQVPEAVCRAIEKAMAKDPADRPASAAAFAEELKAKGAPPARSSEKEPVREPLPTPDVSVDLFGEEGLLGGLVAECVGYPDRRPRNRDLPVIVLLGPRGSGKTERLNRLERNFARVPCTRWDFDARPDWDSSDSLLVRDAVIEVRRDLRKPRKNFGRMDFPRLTLGLLAVSTPHTREDRARALREIKAFVDSDDQVREVAEILSRLPNVPVKQRGVEISVTAMRQLGPIVVKRGLRDARSWYEARLTGAANPEDAVIRLNHMDRRGADERRLVNEILFEAFLADLYSNYNDHRVRHPNRVFNCLALFDNVDSPVGEAFLDLLVTARHRQAQRGPNHCDALAVVATRRHRHRRIDGAAVRASSPDDASYEHWSTLRTRERTAWLYRVELRNLTHEELQRAVAEADLRAIPDKLALFTHRLTDGHPGTVRFVIDAIRYKQESDPSPLNLRKVLELPMPATASGGQNTVEGERSVGATALDALLAGMSAAQRSDLITAAPARDEIAAGRLQPLGITPGTVGELSKVLKDELWAPGATSGSSGFVAHGLLRRLLLWHLAYRPDNAALDGARRVRDLEAPGWTAVHTCLRDHLPGPLDDPDADLGRQYYTLALGDIDTVANFFNEGFREGRLGQWITDLNTVTAAPNRLHALEQLRDCSPREQVDTVCQDVADRDPRQGAIARLIAAKWVIGDPLTVLDRRLVKNVIILELDHLAHDPSAWREFGVFYEEINRYEQLLETWGP